MKERPRRFLNFHSCELEYHICSLTRHEINFVFTCGSIALNINTSSKMQRIESKSWFLAIHIHIYLCMYVCMHTFRKDGIKETFLKNSGLTATPKDWGYLIIMYFNYVSRCMNLRSEV